jgi:hypothetical protein
MKNLEVFLLQQLRLFLFKLVFVLIATLGIWFTVKGTYITLVDHQVISEITIHGK